MARSLLEQTVVFKDRPRLSGGLLRGIFEAKIDYYPVDNVLWYKVI